MTGKCGSLGAMQVTDTATFCATLVDEWAHQGLTDAFVAPGSRSTPLALALASDDRFDVHILHDERSASFAGLGHGLATGRPAVVLCSSGTAAAHFHAAVIEAGLSSVPLIVCTANRPPELWEVGAPQTIDQTKLYGGAPRWFFQPGPPDAVTSNTWRPLARRSVAEATGWSGRPGPVHLDLSFRDPLAGLPGDLPERGAEVPPVAGVHAPATVAVGAPAGPDAVRVAEMIRAIDPAVGGVIVAGRGAGDPDHVLRLGERLGWPVIADHRSGCRVVGRSVAHTDTMLRNPAFARAMLPGMVLRLGEMLTSRITEEWLARSSGPTIAATTGRWVDPAQVASLVIDSGDLADQLLTLDLGEPSDRASAWLTADATAAAAITATLSATDGITEPDVARASLASLVGLNQLGPSPALVVSASMPVRDVEWYGQPAPGVRVLANRGANGIDGVIATAIGVALTGAPTICLIGDVAFLHDATSLTALARRRCDLTIMVVDNDGGGIFSFLPQRSLLDAARFEQLFGTPHGTDVLALARAHGLDTVDLDTVNPNVLTPHGVQVLGFAPTEQRTPTFTASSTPP
ncbi:MAG: 2-succinyl-5-enolpyruvyl-6-hydroxy-3-cyclohexene-1-carboxylic-acid synthase [Acidimicrobiales bacterium]